MATRNFRELSLLYEFRRDMSPPAPFSSVYSFTSTEFMFLLAFYLLEYIINNNRCIIIPYLYMCVPDIMVCWFNMYIVVFHYNQNQVMNNRALSVIWQQSSSTANISIVLKQEQIVIIISYTIQCIHTYTFISSVFSSAFMLILQCWFCHYNHYTTTWTDTLLL